VGNNKRSALKHGANATEVMLWSERYEDYDSLHADLRMEFSPCGSTEEHLVQTLLDLRWRRRRLDCYERITKQKRLNEIRQNNKSSRELEEVVPFAPEFKGADSVEKVEAILSRLPPGYREAILSVWPFEVGAEPAIWGSKVGNALAGQGPETRREGADEFVEIFDLGSFDDDLARMERLDTMIDRTIKRLMQVKTMKQMNSRLQPKLINLSTVERPPAQDRTENHSTQ
jgi:hypothetical protein